MATTAKEKTAEERALEMVDLLIPETRFDGTEEDVRIFVNNKSWQIRRGETVKVPRYVKEVYDNSIAQIKETAKYKEMHKTKSRD